MIGVVLEGRRDRFVVATKFGSDMRGTNGPTTAPRRPQLRTPGRRGVAEAAADRPDRPLPAATSPTRSPRSRRPLGAHRPRPRGQGASTSDAPTSPGWQLADWDWTPARRASSGSSPCRTATRSSTARSRRRSCRRRALRARGAALLPARVRPAHRQVHRGPGGATYGSRARSGPAPWLESADWDRIEALKKYADVREDCAPRRRHRRPRRRSLRRERDLGRHLRGARCGRTPRPCAGSRPRRTSPSWTRSPGLSPGRVMLRCRGAARRGERCRRRSPATCARR
jgi:hypothetical protein